MCCYILILKLAAAMVDPLQLLSGSLRLWLIFCLVASFGRRLYPTYFNIQILPIPFLNIISNESPDNLGQRIQKIHCFCCRNLFPLSVLNGWPLTLDMVTFV